MSVQKPVLSKRAKSAKSQTSSEFAAVRQLLRWFSQHARPLPWRRTRDPYAIWISEIMLQQTQVKTVIPYWERWMRTLPNIAALAAAPEAVVLKLWEGLGYYHRARNLQKAANVLLMEHDGQFPQSVARLLALPGIGRYTAGAIASIAFNQPAPLLDGNVMRVFCRYHGIQQDPLAPATNRMLWTLAQSWVQTADQLSRADKVCERACSALNQSLMELGATICTPRAPRCTECPLRQTCWAQARGNPEKLPVKARRAAVTHRVFAAAVMEHNGRYLVRQRRAGAVNAGLWEFPNFELSSHNDKVTPARIRRELGISARELEELTTIRHSITRYRMELRAWRAKSVAAKLPDESWRWVTRPELEQLALTGAHRRLARQLAVEQ